MSSKLREEFEPRWVAEFVSRNYAEYPVRYRCPLGKISEEAIEKYGVTKGARAFRPWRPEVDALVITKEHLVMIEAKIHKLMDGLSKLPVYKSLIPDTPELKEYVNRDVHMTLLVVKALPWVKDAAEKNGVRVVEYAPDYIIRKYEEYDKYSTPDAISKRQLRKQRMEALGIE